MEEIAARLRPGMIFHDYPFAAPRFLSAPATRCLRCKSANLDTEDVLQNADDGWSEHNPPQERTFWYCRDCSGADATSVGVGVMNEVTRRVAWLERFADAADVGTSGLSRMDTEPLYQIDWDNAGGIEIVPLWKRLPRFGDARRKYLRQAVGLDGAEDWPLQVSTRASALALALRALADDLDGEDEVLEASAIFCGEEISGLEMWKQALAVGPFSRVLFFKRDDENPGGKAVARLEIIEGQQRIEALGQGVPAEVGLRDSTLSAGDGEAYIDALLIRYSGSRLWAAREK